jgi:hypothetical protein
LSLFHDAEMLMKAIHERAPLQGKQ